MDQKSIILTSSGLKNIIKDDDNSFCFIFGEHKIKMEKIFAEFISPNVAHIHLSDPTISQFRISYKINPLFPHFNEIFTEDIVSFIHSISMGSSISINENQAFKLEFISILLGNEELFKLLNSTFPIRYTIANIDNYLKNLCIFYYL